MRIDGIGCDYFSKKNQFNRYYYCLLHVLSLFHWIRLWVISHKCPTRISAASTKTLDQIFAKSYHTSSSTNWIFSNPLFAYRHRSSVTKQFGILAEMKAFRWHAMMLHDANTFRSGTHGSSLCVRIFPWCPNESHNS